jgi:putative membrane protein
MHFFFGKTMATASEKLLLAGSLTLLILALGFAPEADRLTWLLESLPVMIALPVLIATHARFPFTALAYRLMWVFAVILLIGGHYTYAEMPLFNWLRDTLDLSRNYYDRLGHLMQGIAPAIIAREILLRRTPLVRDNWLSFLVCCVVLAISAGYELIEWWVAVLSGDAATAFLATQGDVWDTQWDMFLALCGAIFALWAFTPTHDRQLKALDPTFLIRK